MWLRNFLNWLWNDPVAQAADAIPPAPVQAAPQPEEEASMPKKTDTRAPVNVRDAVTGQFVPRAEAKARPGETVTERRAPKQRKAKTPARKK